MCLSGLLHHTLIDAVPKGGQNVVHPPQHARNHAACLSGQNGQLQGFCRVSDLRANQGGGRRLAEGETRRVFSQVIDAVDYCHRRCMHSSLARTASRMTHIATEASHANRTPEHPLEHTPCIMQCVCGPVPSVISRCLACPSCQFPEQAFLGCEIQSVGFLNPKPPNQTVLRGPQARDPPRPETGEHPDGRRVQRQGRRLWPGGHHYAVLERAVGGVRHARVHCARDHTRRGEAALDCWWWTTCCSNKGAEVGLASAAMLDLGWLSAACGMLGINIFTFLKDFNIKGIAIQ